MRTSTRLSTTAELKSPSTITSTPPSTAGAPIARPARGSRPYAAVYNLSNLSNSGNESIPSSSNVPQLPRGNGSLPASDEVSLPQSNDIEFATFSDSCNALVEDSHTSPVAESLDDSLIDSHTSGLFELSALPILPRESLPPPL